MWLLVFVSIVYTGNLESYAVLRTNTTYNTKQSCEFDREALDLSNSMCIEVKQK